MRARISKLIYLALIVTAMLGWSWALFQGLAWAMDI
jgi:hypothetical protein